MPRAFAALPFDIRSTSSRVGREVLSFLQNTEVLKDLVAAFLVLVLQTQEEVIRTRPGVRMSIIEWLWASQQNNQVFKESTRPLFAVRRMITRVASGIHPLNPVTLKAKRLTCLGAQPNVRGCLVSNRSTETVVYNSPEHWRQGDRQWLQESKCVRDNRFGTTSDTLSVTQPGCVTYMCTLPQEQDCKMQDHTRTRFHVTTFYSSDLLLTSTFDFNELQGIKLKAEALRGNHGQQDDPHTLG